MVEEKELPRSESKQSQQKDREPVSHPSSQRGSSQSLRGSRPDITKSNVETRMLTLIAPPPREPDTRVKSRCSTLPSRYRGAETCYSLPRPSQSTSLTKLQQQPLLTALVPLGSISPKPSSPLHSPVSLSSPQTPLTQQPQASSELFMLKGPPPQLPRSRGKTCCSTLPPRQRAPSPEEAISGLSHSSSCVKLGDRIPPSPSELKRNNTPV